MLVRREDEDARKIVRVPGQFLFGEISQDVVILGVFGIGVGEDVVEEGGDIKEDGLVVEKELREQRQVLRE